MELTVLGSGSKGNATILKNDETTILIDSGFSLKEIVERIEAAGYFANEIDAIVITHSHSDHINSATMLGRKFNIPIYCSSGSKTKLFKRARGGFNKIFDFQSEFSIKQLNFIPISVPHDEEGTVAFHIYANSHKLTFATDLGRVPEGLGRYFEKSQIWVLESNHDSDMLANGPYPPLLQERVASDYGHLSNIQAMDVVKNYCNGETQTVVFGHVSQENNKPSIISNLMEKEILIKKKNLNYYIASQDEVLPKIKW